MRKKSRKAQLFEVAAEPAIEEYNVVVRSKPRNFDFCDFHFLS